MNLVEKEFVFLTTNINGICTNTKLDELQVFMYTHGVNVGLICETHLNPGVNDNRIALNDYHVIRKDRNFSATKKSKGGGLAMYIRVGVPFTEPRVTVPEELEVMWIILRPSSPDSIIVAGIYLPPDSPASMRHLFTQHIVETVDQLRASRPESKTVILGDFNSVFCTGPLERQLGIANIVQQPTRGDGFLDKILTDIRSSNSPSVAAAVGTADHAMVLWKILTKQLKCQNVRSVRPLRESNIRQFGNWICNQNWEYILESENIDQATEELENKLQQAYQQFFPEITYKCKESEPPWITQTIKALIRERNRAQSRHQLGKLQTLRKKVQKEINDAKEKWYKARMKRISENNRGNWYKQISGLTNRQPKSWKLEMQASDISAANEINNFFADICTSYEPLVTRELPAFLPANRSTFEIHPWQVAHYLAHLREGMSVPPGQLPVRLVKEFSVELASPLAHIYNLSIREGYVPLIWRRATIIPVPKKPCPGSPGDLRPISLTPTFSKVLEKIIVPLITEDLRPALDVHQYGNMKGTSTAHYLIRLNHNLLTDLEKPGTLFSMVMFDFRKGFDLVDHTILTQKMIQLGLRAQYTKWITSFLSDRQQRVKMPDGSLSGWKKITCGTPQGTLLGPISFLAMINDAATSTDNRLKYVDDLTIFESCPVDNIESASSLQGTVTGIYEWAKENKMVLNTDKCHVMHICTAKKPLVLPDITIAGESIPICSEVKLLGVNIANNMTWDEQVNNIVARGSKALYMLYIMRRYNPPQEQLLKIYTTYIRPIVEYCSPVFHAGITAAHARQIESVQKRALKIIAGYDHRYQDLLKKFKIDSLADRREKSCLRLGKQMMRNSNHRKLLPQTRQSISGRNTRYMEKLQPFCCSTRLRKSAIPHMTSLLNADMYQ